MNVNNLNTFYAQVAGEAIYCKDAPSNTQVTENSQLAKLSRCLKNIDTSKATNSETFLAEFRKTAVKIYSNYAYLCVT